MATKDLDYHGGQGGVEPQPADFRITLSSKSVKSLEKVSHDLVEEIKKLNLRYKGPIRVPTKTLRITTRKTPCGEGSKTWDRFQMRIHKRFIDTKCVADQIKVITQIYIEPDVDVMVTM